MRAEKCTSESKGIKVFQTSCSLGKTVNVVYLDFSKAFEMVSHREALIGKLRKCGLDEWSMRWIGN